MNRLLSGERSALNGADGIRDIVGKMTRVEASERAANEFQRGNHWRSHAPNPLTHGSALLLFNSSFNLFVAFPF
jgi:hypothetical protein